jgi:GcrA cell cycle regulator
VIGKVRRSIGSFVPRDKRIPASEPSVAPTPAPAVAAPKPPRKPPKPIRPEDFIATAPVPSVTKHVPPHPEGKVSILDLTEYTCRWISGDPRLEDRPYCGKRKPFGQPYCEDHQAMAETPAATFKRRGRAA